VIIQIGKPNIDGKRRLTAKFTVDGNPASLTPLLAVDRAELHAAVQDLVSLAWLSKSKSGEKALARVKRG